jgi:hypothetical protein
MKPNRKTVCARTQYHQQFEKGGSIEKSLLCLLIISTHQSQKKKQQLYRQIFGGSGDAQVRISPIE